MELFQMKTVKELAQEEMLNGNRINKGDFHAKYKTFTLTQRVEEIRKDGWDVKSKTIPGKRGMVEYWLEPEEIERIKNAQYMPISKQIETDEQSVEVDTNIAPGGLEMAQNEFYEQLGLGLLGTSNY